MNRNLRQEYLISYDIQDNKIRNKIYDELLKEGMKPVQKSVFWGFLTYAELKSIYRFIDDIAETFDKILITKTNFNGVGESYLVGHSREEFTDWNEYDVI